MTTTLEYDQLVLSRYRHLKERQRRLYIIATGLPGEVGEVCNLLKKEERDLIDITAHLKEEMSDTLFYLVSLAHEYHFTLQNLIEESAFKLASMPPKGVPDPPVTGI